MPVTSPAASRPCAARRGAAVEVLTPDFRDKPAAIDSVVDAAPEVFNHNTETVPRLYRKVRGPQSDYRWTLHLLRRVKERNPQHQDQDRIDARTGRVAHRGARRAGRPARSGLRVPDARASTCSRTRRGICRWFVICRRKSSTNWGTWPGGWDSSRSPAGPLSAAATMLATWRCPSAMENVGP